MAALADPLGTIRGWGETLGDMNEGMAPDPEPHGHRISDEEKARAALELERASWTAQEYIANTFTNPAQLLTINQLEAQGYSPAEIRGYLEGGLDLSYSGIIKT